MIDAMLDYYGRRAAGDERIYKNFPTAPELVALLEPLSRDLKVTEFEYYWGAGYSVAPG